MFNNDDKYFLTRDEALDRGMEKSMLYIKLIKELNLGRLEKNLLKQ